MQYKNKFSSFSCPWCNVCNIQLALLSAFNQLCRYYHVKALRKNCVISWGLKHEQGEERRIFSGSEFQRDRIETGIQKDRALVLFRLTGATVRRFWEDEERRHLEGGCELQTYAVILYLTTYIKRREEKQDGLKIPNFRHVRTTTLGVGVGAGWGFIHLYNYMYIYLAAPNCISYQSVN